MIRRLSLLALLAATLAGLTSPPAANAAVALATSRSAHTVLGVSVPDPRLGAGLAERLFFPGRLGPVPTGRVVSVSFETWDTADVVRTVRQLHAGSSVDYRHEGERDVRDGQLDVAVWSERTAELGRIIAREGRLGQVFPSIVFMGWSLFPQSGLTGILDRAMTPDLVAWLKATRGFVGWDQYAGPVADQHTPLDDLYGHVARWTNSYGLDWAQLEVGWGGARYNPRGLAQFWRDSFAYVASPAVPRAPRYFYGWNPTGVLDGRMAFQNVPAAATVWRAQPR